MIRRRLSQIAQKWDDEKADKQQFIIIVIKFLLALGQNDKAMFEAIKTGRTNGNIEEAMRNYEVIQKELGEYMIKKVSQD